MFIVVSGLSGSGKSTALRTLEDAGFFITDNLPPELWSPMSDLAQARNYEKVAVSTDARTRDFLAALESSYSRLQKKREDLRVIFLEADDAVLLQRYNLTRRTHPLGESSLMLDFFREQSLLSPLRAIADTVIDTTSLSSSDLSARVISLLNLSQSFELRLMTFGFKHAPPRDADLMLDVRTLPNPYYLPELRPKTGLDPEVSRYVFGDEDSEHFYASVKRYVTESARRAEQNGRHTYSVAIGCTGGQHRSVAVAERLRRELAQESALNPRIVDHRDIPLGEDHGR
jgi:RNase adapter protein RapZ